ncbi:MAG: 23S rRNA (guanosine(2251)-2'-O)-methyltransferase RlmB [Kiritimatiellae bacterium]|nr:23S rRNA (guanosine(2251)-2'-O)-methyltransferase RlmB [Kiritimatiellia bacterium]
MHQRESGPAEVEWLYGRQVLLEVLRAGRRRCRALWVAEGVREGPTVSALEGWARRRGVPVRRCPKSELDRRTASANHQGVVLEAEPFQEAEFEEVLEATRHRDEPPFLVVLDHLQDPQNVGSIMRSAEAAGVHGVVLARDRACGVTPAVVRASSGAVEHLAVTRVANLANAVTEMERRGIRCWALEAAEDARPIYAWDLRGGLAVVVGAEGHGVQKRVRAACSGSVAIPMRGKVASYNAAVAAAIAMYEVRRQRDASLPPQ